MEGEKEKRVKEPTEIAKALLKAGANPNLANKVCGNGSPSPRLSLFTDFWYFSKREESQHVCASAQWRTLSFSRI
jgi:hypothetical protein